MPFVEPGFRYMLEKFDLLKDNYTMFRGCQIFNPESTRTLDLSSLLMDLKRTSFLTQGWFSLRCLK